MPRTLARRVLLQQSRQRFPCINQATSLPVVLAGNASVLETLHSTAVGLPWWATIVTSTVALRSCLTLPIAVYQQRSIGRMIQLAPMLQSWAETLKMQVARESKGKNMDYQKYQSELQKQYRRKVSEIYAHHGCQRWKLLLLPYIQFPLFVSMTMTIRHLCGLELPYYGQLADGPAAELADGGFGWVTDLTVPDPTMVFPVLIGAGNLINVEMNAWLAKGKQTTTQKVLTNIFRVISLLFIPIAAQAPMALGLYWFTSSWYSVAQNIAFRSNRVRQLLHLPIMDASKQQRKQ